MRCRWLVFRIRQSTRIWRRLSRPGCVRRSASRWKTPAGQGAGQARRRPDRHARDADGRRSARPEGHQLSGGDRQSGGKLGLAWVELSTGRFSLMPVMRTELMDEIVRLSPAETLISELSLMHPGRRFCAATAGRRSRFGRRGTFSPSRPGRRCLNSSQPKRWAGSESTIEVWRSRQPGH